MKMRWPIFGSSAAITDRVEALRGGGVSPLVLSIAGVCILVALNAFLAVRLLLVDSPAAGEERIAVAQARMAAAEIAAQRLRGVDSKLQQSDAQATAFYRDRLPFAYSDVATALGGIATRTNVRLTRAQYVQAAPANGVTPLRIDAAVTGDYGSLARFINGVERSRTFFLIESIALSGAQNGLVNLRLRLSTDLREPMPAGAASNAPAMQGGQP